MLSVWPPLRLRPEGEPPPVRARHLFVVPGYDPDAHKRTRMLFVREFGRYARRFGLARHAVSPTREPGQHRLAWSVDAAGEGWATATEVEVLRWDDIVRADFRRPVPVRIALLVVGVLDSLQAGVMRRFFHFNWKFGGVILYPLVMIGLLAILAIGFGLVAAGLADRGLDAVASGAVAPGWRLAARWGVGVAVAMAVTAAATPLFERWFVWHLLHDWVFNWQHGNGWRSDYEARVDRFADRLVDIASTSDCDEIIVFGHSSGSVMAMEVVARAFERADLGGCAASLGLVTVGSCLPLVALNPRAKRVHAGIRALGSNRDLLWVEYQAPQDWMNFPGYNAAQACGVPDDASHNPVLRSARFAEIVDETTYRSILWKPFRMHFQFLMANDRPGEYDFFAMTCGPISLRWRCLDPVETPTMPVAPRREEQELDERAMERRIRGAGLD